MLAFAVPTVHKKEDDEKKSEEEEEEEEIQGHKLTLGRVIRSPAIWWDQVLEEWLWQPRICFVSFRQVRLHKCDEKQVTKKPEEYTTQ